MNFIHFSNVAALVVSALCSGCGLLGGGGAGPVLDGTVLHGRYVDPDAQLSVRIPGSTSMRGLRAEVDGEGAGQLAVAATWAGASMFGWSPVPEGLDAETTYRLVRERILAEIRSSVPTAEQVHAEPLEYRGSRAELFVIHVPGGSSWASVKWFRKTPLDLRMAFLQFRRGDLLLYVANDHTPSLFQFDQTGSEEPGAVPLLDTRREQLIELSDRISLTDPLLGELQRP